MKDANRIPDILYNQLSDLVGRKRTDKYVKDVGYSYHGIVIIISYIKCLNYFKRRPILAIALIIILLYLIYVNYFM
jgi:hypothetical protein